jgi:hypothetical protein
MDMIKNFNEFVNESASTQVSKFSNNEKLNEPFANFFKITQEKIDDFKSVVYSLLHTISHMLIISAGKHSGLSKESISELIFLDSSAIFIYPTSSEGVTLGSISGMFESNLLGFLEDALKDNEICTFDSICMNEQNGACIACTYLSEVNCTHFNKDLSRVYLYGGKNKEILIKKGFWK